MFERVIKLGNSKRRSVGALPLARRNCPVDSGTTVRESEILTTRVETVARWNVPVRRQPEWGRIATQIVVQVRRMCRLDGYDRAARREEAWYRF